MNKLLSLAASNSLAGSADSFISRGGGSTTGGGPSVGVAGGVAGGGGVSSSGGGVGVGGGGVSSVGGMDVGGGGVAVQEAVQQIRAAMAAIVQLNEAAHEAQQLLGIPCSDGWQQLQIAEQQSSGFGSHLIPLPEGTVGLTQQQQQQGLDAEQGGGSSSSGLMEGGGGVGALALSPFQDAAVNSNSGSGARAVRGGGRRSSGGLSADFDNGAGGRPSSFTAGDGGGVWGGGRGVGAGFGAAAGGVGAGGQQGLMRRVSFDAGSLLLGGGSGRADSGRLMGVGAASRAAAIRGRMSVDLSRCPNLVKCEQEQAAALARERQQQQQQQQ